MFILSSLQVGHVLQICNNLQLV